MFHSYYVAAGCSCEPAKQSFLLWPEAVVLGSGYIFYKLICLKQISCKIIVAEEKTNESINY